MVLGAYRWDGKARWRMGTTHLRRWFAAGMAKFHRSIPAPCLDQSIEHAGG
jgi:hypothetical protein